jgi:NitT/TauT family transport system substrate-binding protein
MQLIQSRRDFLAGVSAASAASVLGAGGVLADEAPPETTTIRLIKIPGICIAHQYVAEELLRAEGFTEVHYVASEAGRIQAELVGSGVRTSA